MFADNTVFIIGAGASVEFGMPVGSKLTEQIKQNCKFRFEYGNLQEGAMPIFDYYRNTYDLRDPAKAQEVQARFDLMAQIHRSIDMAESIDEYIFRYSDNPLVAEVGKLHIAYAISKAESECLLSDKAKFSHDVDGFESASKKWIFTFAKALMTGVKASEIETIGNNITIICFNYDRCIERYLEHAICRTYAGVNLETAREIISKINIIHPYGVLGPFEAFPFGSTKRFADMGKNLITWSETVRDEQITAEIDYGIRNADTLVFMGFGYAKQNMDLMHTDREPRRRPISVVDDNMKSKRIYATAFGYKKQAHRKIIQNIVGLWTDNREIQDERDINIEGETVTCGEFIQTNLMNLVE